MLPAVDREHALLPLVGAMRNGAGSGGPIGVVWLLPLVGAMRNAPVAGHVLDAHTLLPLVGAMRNETHARKGRPAPSCCPS